MSIYDGAYPPRRRPKPVLTSHSPEGDFFRVVGFLEDEDDTVKIDTRGAHSVAVYVGDFLALGCVVVFEASIKSGAWFPVAVINADNDYTGPFRPTSLSSSDPTNLPFSGHLEVVAYDKVRVRLSSANPPADAEVVLATFAGTALTRALVYQPANASGSLVPLVVSTKVELTPSSPATATVAATSAVEISSNDLRQGLIITNVSTGGQRISLAFGVAAVLDSGITLYPGDTFCMGEYDFTVSEVRGIASAAGGLLSIQEFT